MKRNRTVRRSLRGRGVSVDVVADVNAVISDGSSATASQAVTVVQQGGHTVHRETTSQPTSRSEEER
jgi:hypothetical protein